MDKYVTKFVGLCFEGVGDSVLEGMSAFGAVIILLEGTEQVTAMRQANRQSPCRHFIRAGAPIAI